MARLRRGLVVELGGGDGAAMEELAGVLLLPVKLLALRRLLLRLMLRLMLLRGQGHVPRGRRLRRQQQLMLMLRLRLRLRLLRREPHHGRGHKGARRLLPVMGALLRQGGLLLVMVHLLLRVPRLLHGRGKGACGRVKCLEAIHAHAISSIHVLLLLLLLR